MNNIDRTVVEGEIMYNKADIIEIQKQLVIPLAESLRQVASSLENPSMLVSVGNLEVVTERLEEIADRLKGIDAALSIIDSHLTN